MAIELYEGQQVTQLGRLRLQHRAGLDPHALLHAIQTPGELLKKSSKNETRRVGEWVVKRSRLEGGLGPLKRTLARDRYRRAWRAANWLHRRGVRVPAPLAYGEWTVLGSVLGNVMVTGFLDGQVNVEVYARQLITQSPQEEVDAFFTGLAAAVNGLIEARAYHADLSGKNIFTRDGRDFYFIDLDGVVLGKRYTDRLRLKNHIQLYDSFCDFCGHATLAKFHSQMLPSAAGFDAWLQAVVQGQKKRRKRHAPDLFSVRARGARKD